MEQVGALADRVRALKYIAQSLHEGTIHTRLFPEIDKILALPEDLGQASVTDRDAVARQVREYEQLFDQLGYSLLKQIMPSTGVSAIFEVVSAADQFKRKVLGAVGRRLPVGDQQRALTHRDAQALTRYSLSIGTPPVTKQMRDLVAHILLGATPAEVAGFRDLLGCNALHFDRLMQIEDELIRSSLHYATLAEETAFLDEACDFLNFEGARTFNRVLITQSPERALELIQEHVFDKFGPSEEPPVCQVQGIDQVDDALLSQMEAAPNQVFVARVTRIPHSLLLPGKATDRMRNVLGRLLLVDCSARARQSNTSIVYTLFPHVAKTLRNIQTAMAGRPANTQMQLRRILEYFAPETLASLRRAIELKLAALAADGVTQADVDRIRVEEWLRQDLRDYLILVKQRRLFDFLLVAGAEETPQRKRLAATLKREVADAWMQYFYSGLAPDSYHAVVVPGGGRGALSLVGEHHRQYVLEEVDHFRRQFLAASQERLATLKRGMEIPDQSTDEIKAAIKQSQLRALSPSQWQEGSDRARLMDYLTRSAMYRVADAASYVTRRTLDGLDHAAFTNVTGGAKAIVKRAFSRAGLGALHGHLEERVGETMDRYDRKMRDVISPFSEVIRGAQHFIDNMKGELDPVAVSDIEGLLESLEQGHFYPMLILSEMGWSYMDVFPDKHFPKSAHLVVPLNKQHELDPIALLARLEELRYLFRRFPELFRLLCKSMLLVLNSPHNPTGIYYRRETVLRLLKLASEYGITVLDDNSYHKLVLSGPKAREGDASVAQIYERHRAQFSEPVRLITVSATTKGLQGAGDRTGFIMANDSSVVEFAARRASEPHLMSLYLTRAKLETGLEAKRCTRALEAIAGRVLAAPSSRSAANDVRALLDEMLPRLSDDSFPVPVFDAILDGYEQLLRLVTRGASRRHISECLSELVAAIKRLRLERRLRDDIEQRVAQVQLALLRAREHAEAITPQGAFYYCVRLCSADDDREVRPFLAALSRHRKVDITYAGKGFVRLSVGGELGGEPGSYDRFGRAVEVYLRLIFEYWEKFDQDGRHPERLDTLFGAGGSNDEALGLAIYELRELLELPPPSASTIQGLPIAPSERGLVNCIEEGRSVADKVFVETAGCSSVEELLASRAFRVLYRRLLKVVYRDDPGLAEVPFAELENQYGPLACQRAYSARRLIDADFRQLLGRLYEAWHSQNTVKVLAAHQDSDERCDKVAAMHGLGRKVGELVTELMHAFELAEVVDPAASAFDLGFEALDGIAAKDTLPSYLQQIIRTSTFCGTTVPLNPAPSFRTGAARRVADYRYGFIRRDAQTSGHASPGIEHFRKRLAAFTEHYDRTQYVCKAVQVGPFPMLLIIHRAYFHLVCDELRLFPQIAAVQRRDALDQLSWDGVLLFGVPAKALGDTYKTGYIIDEKADGDTLPTAWVAREDATDYTGFLKKSLLTLHNEKVKAMGGLPVHGAMITVTFVNGLRKTLVFSADSGTGKSETITAMMEQAHSGRGVGAELSHIDILAGDMLSLWRGEDDQIYAFGTETGDFLRLSDITENWKAHYGDLLRRGSYSNLDHPTNPRVTIPGICDAQKVLCPTRVNGFFYINNYEPVKGSAVEVPDDPHQVLKTVLVRGLRKNKGTSGDQPDLRAGLEHAGRNELVVRYRQRIDELFEWQERVIDGKRRTCLCYRDGARDVYLAKEVLNAAFKGAKLRKHDKPLTVSSVSYDIKLNVYWLEGAGTRKVLLERQTYDQVYEPLVSTFCGNPFVDPARMDQTLDVFAESMRRARVHTGVIRTQLARPGFEFTGPEKAAIAIVKFLMEDEEVNARFQRNKDVVSQAVGAAYGGVLPAGSNLPVEIEGLNLLLLETYESTHIKFRDLTGRPFTISTPFYTYRASSATERRRVFEPAIMRPEVRETIADICKNADYALDLAALEYDMSVYAPVRRFNNIEELTYQVMLINGVISLGSSETEVARFPAEVRKALVIAERLAGGPGAAAVCGTLGKPPASV